MPLSYILFHLLFSGICLMLALRLPGRTPIARGLGFLLVVLWLIGFMIDRKPSFAWMVMRLPGSGWVFVVNLSLELVMVLLAVLWRNAEDRKTRQRAAVLSSLLVAVAVASYSWYFRPAPISLTGVAAADGTCPQTSEDSCSAAAAVTLLARSGIHTTEAQMASLCLTRVGLGTTALGLYRGLSVATAASALRPHLVYVGGPSDLRNAAYPCIISVCLKSDCPPAMRAKMIGYGWEPGVGHSVVLLSIEPKGDWVSVSDPTNGRERWPVGDLNYLWDGYALVLAAR